MSEFSRLLLLSTVFKALTLGGLAAHTCLPGAVQTMESVLGMPELAPKAIWLLLMLCVGLASLPLQV